MSIPWSGSSDPAPDAGWQDPPAARASSPTPRVCIGCKACEVACKEWNGVPEDGLALLGSSYDNTGALGASTWRHVAFIEQPSRSVASRAAWAAPTVDLGMPSFAPPSGARRRVRLAPTRLALSGRAPPTLVGERPDFRWLMSSDVCKHCTHAACLDVCPTGSLFRTEFGTVVVQDDICNGCGYCVPACPFGVIERRDRDPRATKNVGIAQKCTLVLRPARRRADARLRPGLPDPVDPVRRPRRAARAGAAPRRSAARGRGRPTPGSTARTPTTASAAPARCSCCSTSRRSTACRRTRSSPPATCRRCGGARAWRRVDAAGRCGARRLSGRGTSGRRRSAGHRRQGPARHGRAPRGDAARSARWCRTRRSPPTTAARSSRRRRGRTTSPPTSSSAGSPPARRCWAPGADLTGRPALRRTGRLGALAGISLSMRRAGARPRQAEPVRQHAAGGQADVADVGGHLDPHRLRHRWPGLAGAAELASAASARCRGRCGCRPRLLAASGRPAGLGAGARGTGGRVVHRGAAVRHRDAVVARGLPRAAVRLRRLGGGCLRAASA